MSRNILQIYPTAYNYILSSEIPRDISEELSVGYIWERGIYYPVWVNILFSLSVTKHHAVVRDCSMAPRTPGDSRRERLRDKFSARANGGPRSKPKTTIY